MSVRVIAITHFRPCELGSLPSLAQASRRTSLRDVPGVASILACRAVESTTTSLNTMVRRTGLCSLVSRSFWSQLWLRLKICDQNEGDFKQLVGKVTSHSKRHDKTKGKLDQVCEAQSVSLGFAPYINRI